MIAVFVDARGRRALPPRHVRQARLAALVGLENDAPAGTPAPPRQVAAPNPPPLGPAGRVATLWALALACCVAYVGWGLSGPWRFLLERRLTVLATMVVVAVAVAVATVVFHTATANRVITPSIMGYDALSVLLQTLVAATAGLGPWLRADPLLRFAAESALMVGVSMLLYRWLLVGARRSLHVLILAGVVLGVVLRSVSAFVQRLLDPTQFIVLQDRLFASFTGAKPPMIAAAALLCAVAVAVLWRRRAALDVMLLGPEMATGLGIDARRGTLGVLAVVALLVSASTALVGPSGFFGLLAAHLGYLVAGRHAHALTLPAASGAAVIALVGGQFVMERLLGYEGTLSVIVELLGGLVFILLLVRRSRV